MNNILTIRNVSKSFIAGDIVTPVLDNINLEIKEGEIVALVGPSGSGKTTLLQICGLLDNADSGEIIISDTDCATLSESERTKKRLSAIGFIYQFHHLLSDFTAEENVMLPLLIKNVKKDLAKKYASKLLEQMGLEHRKHHFPSNLSGGEQQRVAIARALINRPKLILADEPTGNLDHRSASLVFDLIKNTCKNNNISALIVTHNLELAAKADRVINFLDLQKPN